MSEHTYRGRVAEIRAADGAQRIETDAPEGHVNRTVWLMGLDRARDAKVGDTGVLVYRSNGARGWLAWTPDKHPKGQDIRPGCCVAHWGEPELFGAARHAHRRAPKTDEELAKAAVATAFKGREGNVERHLKRQELETLFLALLQVRRETPGA